jgi:hypothetical protein
MNVQVTWLDYVVRTGRQPSPERGSRQAVFRFGRFGTSCGCKEGSTLQRATNSTWCVTKSVNKRDVCDFLAAVDQGSRIACKRCDVARYRDHDGKLSSELLDLRQRALRLRNEDRSFLVAQFVRSVCGFKATASPNRVSKKWQSPCSLGSACIHCRIDVRGRAEIGVLDACRQPCRDVRRFR